MLDRLEVGQQRREQRNQGTVDDDHPVRRVIDDPRQLLRRQTEVERVQHRAHGGDREVRLDMDGVVPHERRRALPVDHPELLPERVRQLSRPVTDLLEGTALRLPLTGPADHLRCSMNRGPVGQDPGDQQRYVLHRAQHGVLPGRHCLRGSKGCADSAHIPHGMSLGLGDRSRHVEGLSLVAGAAAPGAGWVWWGRRGRGGGARVLCRCRVRVRVGRVSCQGGEGRAGCRWWVFSGGGCRARSGAEGSRGLLGTHLQRGPGIALGAAPGPGATSRG